MARANQQQKRSNIDVICTCAEARREHGRSGSRIFMSLVFVIHRVHHVTLTTLSDRISQRTGLTGPSITAEV